MRAKSDKCTATSASSLEPFRLKSESKVERQMRRSKEAFRALSKEETEEMIYELQVHKVELEMQNDELCKTQEALSQAKTRYFELYDLAPVGYCTLSEEGRITEANLAAAELFGSSSETLKGKLITDFIFAEDQDIYYLYRKEIFSSQPVNACELRLKSPTSKPLWVQLKASVQEESMEILRLVINDISILKSMQEEIILKDKMMMVQARQAAMGEMISMIAHQWRQPLNVISLSVADIQTKQMLNLLNPETINHNSRVITDNIMYMSHTIDDFRNFLSPDKEKERLSIESVIKTIILMVGKGLENNDIELFIDNKSKESVLIHKNSLIQVLVNIFNNAKDALISKDREGSQIHVSIEDKEGAVVISICDNAGGIPSEVIDKIGAPYFTTKADMGTGLGVFIAKTIVENHLDGSLSWHNTKEGACFVIALAFEA